MKERIFISHPYSGDPIENMEKVNKVCKDVWDSGYIPVSPLHLFSFMNNDNDRLEILKMCYRLIDSCDEVWIYGKSRGCNAERDYANSNKVNKKVVLKYELD